MTMSSKFDLNLDYCIDEDVLKGWVGFYKTHKEKAGIRHLDIIEIRSVDKNKTIFCRLNGLGSSIKNKRYLKYLEHCNDEEKLKSSIFLDDYYIKKLGLENDDVGKIHPFIINKPINFLEKTWYSLRYGWNHPDDTIKLATYLGVISVILGVLSLLLGIASLI